MFFYIFFYFFYPKKSPGKARRLSKRICGSRHIRGRHRYKRYYIFSDIFGWIFGAGNLTNMPTTTQNKKKTALALGHLLTFLNKHQLHYLEYYSLFHQNQMFLRLNFSSCSMGLNMYFQQKQIFLQGLAYSYHDRHKNCNPFRLPLKYQSLISPIVSGFCSYTTFCSYLLHLTYQMKTYSN